VLCSLLLRIYTDALCDCGPCLASAWTAIVRRAFGAHRFGMNLAIYNSAIGVGSVVFNGLAGAATALAVARSSAPDAEVDGERTIHPALVYRYIFYPSTLNPKPQTLNPGP